MKYILIPQLSMIDLDDAFKIIDKYVFPLGKETVSLDRCIGHVLGQNIVASDPIPRFDSSAVDGYGVRMKDISLVSPGKPIVLRLSGAIQAGSESETRLENGTAIKIYTGAPIPKGIQAVIMKEHVDADGNTIKISRSPAIGENIRRKGEEFEKNSIILNEGIPVTPPVIGLLATAGYAKVTVFRKPRISVITTGDELKSPSSKLRYGQIIDSNLYTITGVLQELGIPAVSSIRVKDSKRSIRKAFETAFQTADVVISVGGVSVGDYDFVNKIINELGFETHYNKLAIKPGKPNVFATKGRNFIFGLPGNPVSALLSFHLLVKPAILKLMGKAQTQRFSLKAVLDSDLRKKAGRCEFVRANLSKNSNGEFHVVPVPGQDSHMLSGLARANSMIIFPKELSLLSSGSLVDVEMLSWREI